MIYLVATAVSLWILAGGGSQAAPVSETRL